MSNSVRNMKVAIFGAGPCGISLALYLLQHQCEVLLHTHPEHRRTLNAITKAGHVESEGEIQGSFLLNITESTVEAITFSKFLILAVPSNAHEALVSAFEKLNERLSEHIIISIPSNFFPFLVEGRIKIKVVAGVASSPYTAKVHRGKLLVKFTKRELAIASLPANPEKEVTNQISRIFPQQLIWRSHVIAVDFGCIGSIMHVAPTLMNVGWIERTGGDFGLYPDGMTESVVTIVNELDKERLEIAKRYDQQIESTLDTMNRYYDTSYSTIRELTLHSKPHTMTKWAPSTMQHRVVTQDVPCSIVPWYQLGLKVGYRARHMESFILLASTINHQDYMCTGRNLKKLRIDEAAKDDILSLCNKGK